MSEQSVTAWRFLNNAFGNAFSNMATDEQLVHSVAGGKAPPTVRVYGWEPAAVSFGYAQKIAKEVDLEEAAKRGIDIVRRPTGGRAVLHWNELTYSVICPADHPIIGGNISSVYRSISECLVAGLTTLGVNAKLEPKRSRVPSPRGKDVTSPCFSSTSQYEITLRGKKLVGSAQRRIGEMVLQHGSLLIGPEHKQVIELMAPGHERLKTAYAEQLESRTISLEEAGHTGLLFEKLAEGIRQGFGDVLGVELSETPLTPEERIGIDTLIATKYETPDWNQLDRSAEVTRSIPA
jgi:lipoate-protein ligase A